jgi:hypothetical protein
MPCSSAPENKDFIVKQKVYESLPRSHHPGFYTKLVSLGWAGALFKQLTLYVYKHQLPTHIGFGVEEGEDYPLLTHLLEEFQAYTHHRK